MSGICFTLILVHKNKHTIHLVRSMVSVFAENICPFFGTGGYWHIFLVLKCNLLCVPSVESECSMIMFVYFEKTNEFKREAINKRNANDSIIESNELLNFYFFGSVGVFFSVVLVMKWILCKKIPLTYIVANLENHINDNW